VLLEMKTNQSHIRIAQAATLCLRLDGQRIDSPPLIHCSDDYVGHDHSIDIKSGNTLYVEKIAALYTSRDKAIYEPAAEACQAANERLHFNQLLNSHITLWKQLWDRFDLDIHHVEHEVEERTVRILRLHIFHLLQTTSPNTMDLDTGMPARGWHGEAYRGHIFWDELFVFPLFNLRMPEITRALLLYRYRRLPQARLAAAQAGYRGAMFPWQSGSNGREESQRLHLNPKSGRWIPDNTRLQHHVNAAIAYNIWQYFEATRDMEFMAFYGAEVFLEIARFWASIATFNKQRKRYGIRNVMGPDEYHDAYPDGHPLKNSELTGLTNNAYTNIMAVWVLCRALELRELMPSRRWEELCELLQLGVDELEHWDDISRRMLILFHDDGIISQFEGYEQLREFDWQVYRDKYGDIQRLDRILEAENDTVNRYKASKQADVLMLFYLFSSEELSSMFQRLGYAFEYETIPRNIDYYIKRTSHGSTLSRVVHSWVLARADRPGAWKQFSQALQSDIADIQGGTTQEGIHAGAMAGTVDVIQRCFTGIEIRGGVLWLNPRLPQELMRLALHIQYRQHMLELYVTNTYVRISTAPSEERAITIGIKDKLHQLNPGEIKEIEL
jgi:alpha,alpha-trehalase